MRRHLVAVAAILVVAGSAALIGLSLRGAVSREQRASAAPGDAAPPATLEQVINELLPRPGSLPGPGEPWALVIGDSVSAGVTLDPARIGHNPSWPGVAETELRGLGRPWHLVDVACPGESTASYATGCPYTQLSAWLAGRTQRQAGLDAIATGRPQLRAIVVELGANDLVSARTLGAAVDPTVEGIRTRLDAIVTELQSAAPNVPVVLCTIYDPYSPDDVLARVSVDAANQRIREVAVAHRVAVAAVAEVMAGSTVAALCALVDCHDGDIHPTAAGHVRIAGAVVAALTAPGVPRPGL